MDEKDGLRLKMGAKWSVHKFFGRARGLLNLGVKLKDYKNCGYL